MTFNQGLILKVLKDITASLAISDNIIWSNEFLRSLVTKETSKKVWLYAITIVSYAKVEILYMLGIGHLVNFISNS